MKLVQRAFFLVLFSLTSVLSSCDELQIPYQLKVISGDNQEGLQYEELANEIIVEVGYENGKIVPGVMVIITGDGSYSTNSMVSDENGRIKLKWILGKEYTQSLEIIVKDSPGSMITLHARAKYKYRVPSLISDGWEVGNIANYLVDSELLFNGINQIRKGYFSKIHSILIIMDKKLLLEEYYPGYTSSGEYKDFNLNTKHEVQSASKSFRSALIGIAIDEGIIESTDVPIYTFFPDLSDLFDDDKKEIKLEHILTMSSGLQWDEKSNTGSNDLTRMYSTPYDQWVHYILSKPLEYSPGTTFVYNTGASIMLNNIIISRTDFDELARNKYANLVESVDLPGVGNPLTGTTTPRDMAKLGYVFLYEGYWKSTRVISQEWIEKSTQKVFEVEQGLWYGYQWWIKSLDTPAGSFEVVFANGNGGQFIMYIKEMDLLVVSTGGNFFSDKMWQIYDLLSMYIIPSIIR